MTTAQSILLIYGVFILTYGFALGIPLAAARMKAPQASRHLVTTHLSAIIQGPIHFGLAFAAGVADLSAGWATAAASLVVAGSAFEVAGGTVNWLANTGDQFAERSFGFRLNSLVGPPAISGMLIIAIGVVKGL